jgi:hypothetical protein
MIIEEFITCITELDMRKHCHAKTWIYSLEAGELFPGVALLNSCKVKFW